jgi:DNA-directed RNA polymerase beta' subunit
MLEQHFGKIIISILLTIVLVFALMFYKSNQKHQEYLQDEINQLKNKSIEQTQKNIEFQQQVLDEQAQKNLQLQKDVIDKQSQINQLKEQKLDQQIDEIETVVGELKDQQIEEKQLREEYVKMSKGALNAAYISQGLQTASLFKIYIAEYFSSEGKFPNNNKQLNLPTANSYASDYINGVWVSRGGKITIVYKQYSGIDNGAISLVPKFKNDQLFWKCTTRDFKNIQQLIPQCYYSQAN